MIEIAFWILCGVCCGGIVGYGLGFLYGDHRGTKDTEQRWSEAVAKANYQRAMDRP